MPRPVVKRRTARKRIQYSRRKPQMTIAKAIKSLDFHGYPHRLMWDDIYVYPMAGTLVRTFTDNTTPTWAKIGSTTTNNLGGGTVASIGAGMAFQFKFSNTVQAGEFAVMYDAYKLMRIKMKISLMSDYLMSSNSTARGLIPEVYIANDYDDDTPPSNDGVLKQYANTRLRRLTSQHPDITTYVVPKTASLVYTDDNLAGIGYQQNKTNQWVDMDYTQVPYYGIKLWFDNICTTLDAGVLIRIQVFGDFKLKTQR